MSGRMGPEAEHGRLAEICEMLDQKRAVLDVLRRLHAGRK